MRVMLRIAVISFAVLAIVLAYLRSMPVDAIPVGTPVRQDDFTYTVTRVVKEKSSENVAYVVTIRVDNEAKRVDFRWSDDIAFVTDSTGKKYQAVMPSPSVADDRPAIPPGESATYDLTFDLPADAKSPMLHYWNGILMGDV